MNKKITTYNLYIFSIIFLFACNADAVHNETKKEVVSKTDVDFFSPNTIYKTSIITYDFVKSEQKQYFEIWEKAGYLIFDDIQLDSFNHQQFEMVNVFSHKNHIVLFNETKKMGDSIEHTILDTLFNFDAFTDTLKNISTSIGIINKAGLQGINVDTIPTNSIVAITQNNDETQLLDKIDSALKIKNKQPLYPISIKNNGTVLKAWFANTKTKKFQLIK